MRQFARDRSHVALTLLLGFACAATAGLTTSAQGDLNALIQRDWRGAYDLLVLPADASGHTDTAGFVEPNFVTLSEAPRITDGQVSKIRALSGVDVAAPIGVVGTVRNLAVNPVVTAPPGAHGVYRIDASVTQTAGGLQQPLYSTSGCIGPDIRSATDVPIAASTFQDVVETEFGSSIYLPPLPAAPATIIAVDPAAERALLGGAGAFLDPLAERAETIRTASTYPASTIPNRFAFERDVMVALGASDSPADRSKPVVPVVVLESSRAATTLTARFRKLGTDRPTPADSGQLSTVCRDGRQFDVGTEVQVDAAPALAPFRRQQALIPWPGQGTAPDPGPLSKVAADVRPTVTTGARYTPMGTGAGLTFRVQPFGTVLINGTTTGNADRGPGATVQYGQERAYRKQLAATGTPIPAGQQADSPYISAPVGAVQLSALGQGADRASYVPLGGYDSTPIRMSSLPHEGPLPTSLSGQGLVVAPPAAVTDLAGGRTLRGKSPIDAVRVRLSGVTKFEPDARQRIEDVAARIGALGLSVRVVAGSSLETVTVKAPDFLNVPNGPTHEPARPTQSHDLMTSQEWTSLGAALRVLNALTATSKALLALAAIVLTGLGAMSASMQIPQRRRQLQALATHGWTRTNLRRLLLGECAMGVAVITVISGAAGVVAGFSRTQLIVTAAVLTAYSLFAALTAHAALRTLTSQTRVGQRQGVRTTTRAVALSLIRPVMWPLLARAAAAAIAAGCGAAAGLLIARADLEAGPSRIATTILDELQPQQWLLLSVVLATAVLAILLASEVVHRGRRSALAILHGCGWSRPQRLATLTPPFLCLLAPSAVLAALVFRMAAPDAPTFAFVWAVALCLIITALMHFNDGRRVG